MTHPNSSPPDTPSGSTTDLAAEGTTDGDSGCMAVGRLRPSITTPRSPSRRAPSPWQFTGVVGVVGTAALLVIASAGPAVAAPPASLDEVISRITTWIVRLAFGLATLFITYGAVRLLTAGGDPAAAEKGKAAIRGAALGFSLALLAPLIVSVLASFVS